MYWCFHDVINMLRYMYKVHLLLKFVILNVNIEGERKGDWEKNCHDVFADECDRHPLGKNIDLNFDLIGYRIYSNVLYLPYILWFAVFISFRCSHQVLLKLYWKSRYKKFLWKVKVYNASILVRSCRPTYEFTAKNNNLIFDHHHLHNYTST